MKGRVRLMIMSIVGSAVIVGGGVVLFKVLRRKQEQRWAAIFAEWNRREAEWRSVLARGGEIFIEVPHGQISSAIIGLPDVVPDVLGEGTTTVSCPCGNVTIGPLMSSGSVAAVTLECPVCRAVVEQMVVRTDQEGL